MDYRYDKGANMKFRLHKGNLEESMATVIEIAPHKKALANAINRLLCDSIATAENIKVDEYGYDPRIDWKCYIVSVDNLGPVGWVDGPVLALDDSTLSYSEEYILGFMKGWSLRGGILNHPRDRYEVRHNNNTYAEYDTIKRLYYAMMKKGGF